MRSCKRDALVSEPGNQRRTYDEWSEFAKDNQFRRQTANGSALYMNEIGGSIRQVRNALASSAAGNTATGCVGYSITADPRARVHEQRGPGLAPSARVPSGTSGRHAFWYGQSGYPTLCAGDRSTATVAFYHSGTVGWVAGRMGEVAYLGTWEPEPGQDRASVLGGDGTNGSPATGWPRFNRVALQPAQYVGRNQVAWLQFTVQAPSTPGTYRLAIRPLIEGAQWLEDYGVFWFVTVK